MSQRYDAVVFFFASLTDSKSRAHQLNTDKLGLGPLYQNFLLAIYLGTLIPAPLRNPTPGPQKFSR